MTTKKYHAPKSHVLQFRVSKALYDSITAAASLRRTSISAEAKRRLTESFTGSEFDKDFVRILENGAGDAVREIFQALQNSSKKEGTSA